MIKLKSVTFAPGGRRVLDSIDLEVNTGELFVVMGASGAGKSTILRLINGLISPDSGAIYVDDIDVTKLSEKELVPIRRNVGMVFQSAALFDSLTVAENVGFAWRKQKMRASERAKKIEDTLSVVGLSGASEMMPAELSGGMKKRVGLARTIAMNPQVLLYDEPTSGLDPMSSTKILELIKDLNQRLKVTSIVVTHDLVGAFSIADRVALLSDGKIVFVGTAEEMQASEIDSVIQFISGSNLSGLYAR